MKTGYKIRGYRVMKRLTQANFADEMGVSDTTVKNWESGKVIPRMDEGERIALLLGVTYDDIKGDDLLPTTPEPEVV